MTREIEAGDLAKQLERWRSLSWVPELIADLRKMPTGAALRISVVSANELHSIYSVRLQRYQEGYGPSCEHFEEFVSALATSGDLELLGVNGKKARWIVILRDGEPKSYVRVSYTDRGAQN